MTQARRPAFSLALGLAFALASTLASAQDNLVLRDLDGAVVLSKEELQQLLPGAGMARMTSRGNQHLWKNEAGGSFIVSSDNRATSQPPSSAQGKWHISEDGRYCVLMEWKSGPEEWCRYVVKTGKGYYSVKSDKVMTEKVFKLEISK